MISKISDLLEVFIQHEQEIIGKIDIPHMPTLGEAYEKITQDGLNMGCILPADLGLHATSGFVSIEGETISNQIDCMIVYGEGTKVGRTDKYIYDIDQIIAIFEVKKSLSKADYKDAFLHLASVKRKACDHYRRLLDSGSLNPELSAARKAFSQITGKPAPESYIGLHRLQRTEQMLFYTLSMEQLCPSMIIHAYGGYKTESGFRRALMKLMEEEFEKGGGEGLGIPSFPTLVSSANFSVVKANGLPFTSIPEPKGLYIALSSCRHNALRLIIEIVWSKIADTFSLKMPWHDGLYMENMYPLLIADPHIEDTAGGWILKFINYTEGKLSRDDNNSWEPFKLGRAASHLAKLIIFAGGTLPVDHQIEEELEGYSDLTTSDLISEVLNTHEFTYDGNQIAVLNRVLCLLPCDNGESYASSERERFIEWCNSCGLAPNFINLLRTD